MSIFTPPLNFIAWTWCSVRSHHLIRGVIIIQDVYHNKCLKLKPYVVYLNYGVAIFNLGISIKKNKAKDYT